MFHQCAKVNDSTILLGVLTLSFDGEREEDVTGRSHVTGNEPLGSRKVLGKSNVFLGPKAERWKVALSCFFCQG
jgi:sorbitol-specific phosphotransferase system component IIA